MQPKKKPSMYDEGKCPLNNVKGENRQQNHTVYTCASFSLQKNSEGERARRALFEWLSFSNMAMGSIILLLMQTLRENLCQPPHGRLILRPPHLLPVPLWRSGHSLGPQHLFVQEGAHYSPEPGVMASARSGGGVVGKVFRHT